MNGIENGQGTPSPESIGTDLDFSHDLSPFGRGSRPCVCRPMLSLSSRLSPLLSQRTVARLVSMLRVQAACFPIVSGFLINLYGGSLSRMAWVGGAMVEGPSRIGFLCVVGQATALQWLGGRGVCGFLRAVYAISIACPGQTDHR
jgi:hypothetical protein